MGFMNVSVTHLKRIEKCIPYGDKYDNQSRVYVSFTGSRLEDFVIGLAKSAAREIEHLNFIENF